MRRPVSNSHQLHSGVYMDWWIDSCHFKERVRRIWQFWISSLGSHFEHCPRSMRYHLSLMDIPVSQQRHAPWCFSRAQIQSFVRVLDILV